MSRAAETVRLRDFVLADAPALHAIEHAATLLLAAHGYPQLLDEPAATVAEFAAWLLAEGRVRIAETDDGTVAGFSLAGPVGAAYYLKQLSVAAEFGRQGSGSKLLEDFLEEARRIRAPLVALSTFRDVPFNAPFYARRGFAELSPEQASPALRRRFEAEIPPGVAASRRLLMSRKP